MKIKARLISCDSPLVFRNEPTVIFAGRKVEKERTLAVHRKKNREGRGGERRGGGERGGGGDRRNARGKMYHSTRQANSVTE